MQWSRRFIGLKVFMSLAERGLGGYGRMIERQAELGEYLRTRLIAAGWSIMNRTPLPVICFTREGIDVKRVLHELTMNQIAWMSPVSVNGREAIRACITSFRTTEQDIDRIVEALSRIA